MTNRQYEIAVLATDDLHPESEIHQKCQLAQDLNTAVSHAVELELPEAEILNLMNDGITAASHAAATLIEGRLTLNPCSVLGLLAFALANMLTVYDQMPLPILLGKIIKITMEIKGPGAFEEMMAVGEMLERAATLLEDTRPIDPTGMPDLPGLRHCRKPTMH